jgi:hypothetical protein
MKQSSEVKARVTVTSAEAEIRGQEIEAKSTGDYSEAVQQAHRCTAISKG